MLLRELFIREVAQPAAPVQLGRAFNHPEHFVIFHGVSGILEALQHFEEIAQENNGEGTVRFKWDGNPQIYWGREQAGGPLILAGHNGWGKGGRNTGTTMDDFTSQRALQNFLLNKSGEGAKGEPVTPERQRFAKEFSSLYPIFEAATPKDFVGFVYADAIFVPSTKPKADNSGTYNMHPNPHSDTEYHVSVNSELGKRIGQAQIMVAGHGYFETFGAPDSDQQPKEDFDEFNGNPSLIVLSPIYNGEAPQINKAPIEELKKAEGYIKTHGAAIDSFVGSISHTDKNGIFYPFLNQQNAAGTFDQINSAIFFDWMAKVKPNGKPNVTLPKQQAIRQLAQQTNALDAMFHVMKEIRNVKHDIYNIINNKQSHDIWATSHEGYVRYAQDHHKHGNIKIVAPGWKK